MAVGVVIVATSILMYIRKNSVRNSSTNMSQNELEENGETLNSPEDAMHDFFLWKVFCPLLNHNFDFGGMFSLLTELDVNILA